MFNTYENKYLVVAGYCNWLAALTHVFIIVGGADWYRFFGAGEAMAQAAEQGSIRPDITTGIIAMLLTFLGVIAMSGADKLPRLPLLKTALCLITFVYLSRGIAGLVLPFISQHPLIQQNSTTFWLVSSSICLIIGMLHLIGTIKLWNGNTQK